MKKIIYNSLRGTIKAIIVVCVVSLGILNVSAWTGPPGPPFTCPAGHQGCDGPIHVGNTTQTKAGGLWAGGIFSSGAGYFAQPVGIGTVPVAGYMFDINGKAKMHDLDVNNVITANKVKIGGGSAATYPLRVGGGTSDALTGYFDGAGTGSYNYNRVGINHPSNTGLGLYIGGDLKWSVASYDTGTSEPNFDYSVYNSQTNKDSLFIDGNTDNVGVGTNNPSYRLDVQGGKINAGGGFVIEKRTSDPVAPETGQMWLRTDI